MSMPGDNLSPALVVGSGITALAVVRALGRRGVPLHVISRRPGIVRASRWFRAPPHGKTLSDVADLATYLQTLPIEGGVLIPTSDHAALAVAELPAGLRGRFRSSQAPAPVLRIFLDKERLRALLDAHGVPHPRTWAVEGGADVRDLDDADLRTVFIKPRDSQAFSRRMGVKALRPAGRRELHRDLARVRDEGLAVVLQEFVPGPPTHHVFLDGFVDRRGRVCARLARRRLRSFPVEFGNSCATESIPLEDIAPAASDLERLLGAVGYRGPFDAEFKLDERDGAFRLLEVNVRPWWQVGFAALCGVDVVTMGYRDALGLPVEDVPGYEVGVRWMLVYRDLRACVHLLRSGEITLGGWLGSWMGSHWGEFATDDPLPGLAAGVAPFGRLLTRGASRRRVPLRGRERASGRRPAPRG